MQIQHHIKLGYRVEFYLSFGFDNKLNHPYSFIYHFEMEKIASDRSLKTLTQISHILTNYALDVSKTQYNLRISEIALHTALLCISL